MFSLADFDSRVLLKVLLNPVSILKNNYDVVVTDSDRLIFLDILQVLKDNSMESALNPDYVSKQDVNLAIQFMNGLVKNDNNFNSYKKLLKYCTKMCFLDTLFFRTMQYTDKTPTYSIIGIIPSMSKIEYQSIAPISSFEGKDFSKLYVLDDLDNIDAIFRFLGISISDIKHATFGYILSEFPTVINLCNRDKVNHIIADSESDVVISYLMRSLYLMMHYNLYTVISSNADKNKKEVNLIEAQY